MFNPFSVFRPSSILLGVFGAAVAIAVLWPSPPASAATYGVAAFVVVGLAAEGVQRVLGGKGKSGSSAPDGKGMGDGPK